MRRGRPAATSRVRDWWLGPEPLDFRLQGKPASAAAKAMLSSTGRWTASCARARRGCWAVRLRRVIMRPTAQSIRAVAASAEWRCRGLTAADDVFYRSLGKGTQALLYLPEFGL